MEDGRCLLDVIGDPKLLNEFLKDGTDVDSSLSADNQISENDFKWTEEEFLSSTLGTSENDCSDSSSLIKFQALISTPQAQTQSSAVVTASSAAAVSQSTQPPPAVSLPPPPPPPPPALPSSSLSVPATVAALAAAPEISQSSVVTTTPSISSVAGTQQVTALLSPHSANFGQVQLVQPGCSSGLSQDQKSTYQNFASLGNVGQGIPIQVIQGQQLILKTAAGNTIGFAQQQQQQQLQQQQQQQLQQQQLQQLQLQHFQQQLQQQQQQQQQQHQQQHHHQQQQQSKVNQIQHLQVSSASSPGVSRSLTPSQSPAPNNSPLVSRSLTPSQGQNTGLVTISPSFSGQHPNSVSPSPNVSVVQIPTSVQSQPSTQQQLQAAAAAAAGGVPIQNLVPTQNTQHLQNLLPGQAVLPTQGQNIVHTQNTVIQNPNVVNVNVAHVLCNNSAQQANQQGGMVSVYPNVQAASSSNPVTLHGTIINIPQGKSIIIPGFSNLQQVQNLQLPSSHVGQQVSGTGTLLHAAGATQQPVAGAAGMAMGSAAGMAVGGAGTMQLSGQQSQEKAATLAAAAAGQSNYSFVNINPPPIILRTLPSNLIQIQSTTNSGQSSTVNTQVQSYPQISQAQLINTSAAQGSIPMQQVVNPLQGQQLKVIGHPGLQVAGSQPGTVTVNIGGQNFNLQSLPSNQLGALQFQSGRQVLIQAPPSHTLPLQTTSVKTTVPSGQEISSISPQNSALTTMQVIQNANTTATIGNQRSNSRTKTPPTKSSKSSSSKHNSHSAHSSRNRASPLQQQQQVQAIHNFQLPLPQVTHPHSLNSSPGLSTAHSTTVTTTVSQSLVQMPSQVSVASSLVGVQVSSSTVQNKPISSSGLVQTSGSSAVANQTQAAATVLNTRLPAIQITPQDPIIMARVENDVSSLVSLKNPNRTQKANLEKLALLQKKLSQGQLQFATSGQVGQPQIAHPPTAQAAAIAQQTLLQQASASTPSAATSINQINQLLQQQACVNQQHQQQQQQQHHQQQQHQQQQQQQQQQHSQQLDSSVTNMVGGDVSSVPDDDVFQFPPPPPPYSSDVQIGVPYQVSSSEDLCCCEGPVDHHFTPSTSSPSLEYPMF